MKKLNFVVLCLMVGLLFEGPLHAQWVQTNNHYRNSVSCFAVSGTNLFAGTYAGGVFRSTNNGTSWAAINTGLTNTDVHGIHALAAVGSNIFVGTYSGVFRSTDNGRRWTAVNIGLPNDANVSSFAVAGSDIFVGSGSHGVFLSTNNGTSWAAVDTGLPNNSHYAQAIHSQGFHLVNTSLPNPYVNALAAVGPNIFVGIPGAVFRSTIDGTRWMHTPNNFVRGITLKAPVSDIPRFVTFIDKELAPRGVNTLVLRINYSLQWITHPELNDTMVLKISDALKIKAICK